MTEGTHLPSKIKRVWQVSAFINFAIWLAIGIGCYLGLKFLHWEWLFWPGIGFGAIAIIDLIFELILVPYRYAFWRYRLTDDAVELQSGYIFKKMVSIPIARVQDVTLSAGPVLQSQKLQKVDVTTASTSHKIDGLEPQVAEQLRKQIMRLAVEVKENDV
ncbi:PH domain-containing protein [Lentilactobacillus farraginis]|uniref:YdbS-like PH domain-containing protein n=1 Tax=Lentilactobacillus farraginis DSM 18382 = JCM 14108 TaxID=1423743 RepID=X0PMK8_9LACO|nr:PH domain-containing protein [Lentilactobacillus farraginis]GAF38081.1 hypothetical protein JCM14108_3183 [Lentilactobacillus farraginis DSM 18382 = JCM 14108]